MKRMFFLFFLASQPVVAMQNAIEAQEVDDLTLSDSDDETLDSTPLDKFEKAEKNTTDPDFDKQMAATNKQIVLLALKAGNLPIIRRYVLKGALSGIDNTLLQQQLANHLPNKRKEILEVIEKAQKELEGKSTL